MIQELERKETHDKLNSHTRIYVYGPHESWEKGQNRVRGRVAHCGFEADIDGLSDDLEGLEDVD